MTDTRLTRYSWSAFFFLHLSLQYSTPQSHVMTYTLHKRRLAPRPARPIQYKTCLIPMSTLSCFRSSSLVYSLLSNPCPEDLFA